MSPRKYTPEETQNFAKRLRMLPTKTEALLFNALTKALSRTTSRAHFQYVIGPYIADIYIPDAKLIIEADGASHAGRKQYDERREAYMTKCGFRTLRFTNVEIRQNWSGVVAKILAECGDLKPYVPGEVKVTICPPRHANGHKRRKYWL